MLDLAKEGLIDTLRNKGFRITELSEKDIDDLGELRALIEVPTVRRITEAGVHPAAIEQLRPLAAEIEEAAARHDLPAHVAIDMQFHLKLLHSQATPTSWRRVRSLRSRSRIYRLRTLAERDELVPSSREHAELLDLIAARDVECAEQLMNRHIRQVRGIWAECPVALRFERRPESARSAARADNP